MGCQAKVQNNGRNVVQGGHTIPGWFSGKGYLRPAFPFNAWHHFGFYIFETATAFTDAEADQIDVDFPAHNQLGPPGGPNPAYLVEEGASLLKFTSPPVARTWIDVTTSYFSRVHMSRGAAIVPSLAESSFYKLACPCNLAINFPGLGNNGDRECNDGAAPM